MLTFVKVAQREERAFGSVKTKEEGPFGIVLHQFARMFRKNWIR
jgi:hypothetical protein